MSAEFPGLGADSVVLITAAASGIGSHMAEAFSRQGCAVHVCDIDEPALLSFLADRPKLTGTHADVSDPDQVTSLFADLLKAYGRLDVLINNAGVAGPAVPVGRITTEDWIRTLDVDLNSVFYCTRAASELLVASKGVMINMSSTAGEFGCPNRSAYVAAKWAIRGLTKTWAMEMGPDGVRVNALCPGSVAGPRLDGVIERDARERGLSREEVADMYTAQTSMRRFVEAEDVVNMALFLASDLGRHISGQCISIDGHTESLSDATAHIQRGA